MPGCVATMDKVKPVFETMKSWKEDISGCRNYDDLPKECKAYIARIEELLGVEVVLVSVGPDEKQTLVRKEIF
jgi:adenylosuccinate synthase